MEKAKSNKNKLIFIITFFGLNILNSILLTTNVILDNLSPFPRTIFMVINSFFGDFGFLLIFVGLSVVVFKKDYSRAKFLMILSIVLGFIYFGFSVYFQHYNMFFSFYNLSAFKSGSNTDTVGFIFSSLLLLLTSAKFIFLLSSLLIIFFFLRLFKRYKSHKNFYNSSLVKGKDRVLIGLGLFIAGALLMASGLSAFRVDIEDTWYEDNTTPLYGAQTVGLFNYYIYEGYSILTNRFTNVSPDKFKTVEEKLEDLKNPNDGIYNEYSGIFEDKNLLLIQLESFNNFLIGLEIEVNGEFLEVTPNLNRIVENSIYFNNFYNSVGIGNTSDSEFTVLSGIYPIGNDYIIYDHDKVQYPTLPVLFKEKGYYTFSSHANTEKFYERSRVHTTLYGYHNHYGKESLNIDSKSLIHTWLNDRDFLIQNIERLNEEAKANQVFAHLITITSHIPYNKPIEAKEGNWFVGKDNLFPADFSLIEDNMILNQQIQGYLEHAAYADYAIGEALSKLEELGLNENTVVVLYGDHGSDIDAFELYYKNKSILKNDINEMIDYVYDDQSRALQNRLFNANIPFIIYDPSSNPKLEANTITYVRGTNTIARTIANLFALEPEYYFGIDALSNNKTYAYNPRNLDIYADGVIVSGQSFEYYIVDDSYNYTDSDIRDIVTRFRAYKDFNDKLIKYKVFPLLK